MILKILVLSAVTVSCQDDLRLPDVVEKSFPQFRQTIDTLPEQIHLSLGRDTDSMVVMWATADEYDEGPSYVKYGLAPNNFSLVVKAQAEDMGFLANEYGTKGLFRGCMTSLEPGRVYSYRVETNGHMSPSYEFRHLNDTADRLSSFIVYGDLGKVGGSYTMKQLVKEARSRLHDAFIHVGDFAYNLDDDGGRRGDDFMNRIQPIATTVPYMTCPGNHEIFHSFQHYRHRFSMPGTEWPTNVFKMWYSFDVGLVHFISYSTEVYFTTDGAYRPNQYRWLVKDLTEANLNRAIRPWIIAFGHRPMYCSNTNADDCRQERSQMRQEPYDIETLFYRFGVDVIIQAHEHSYERLYPVYNDTQTDCGYKNPKSPVHIITGAAGCNEREMLCADVFLSEPRPFSAERSWLPGLNGFGRLVVHNQTHLHWEQVLSVSEQPLDSVWIYQDLHTTRNVSDLIPRNDCSELT